MKFLRALLIMLMLGINYAGSCQTSLVPLKAWVKKLDNPSDIENKGVEEISKLIFSEDTAKAIPVGRIEEGRC